MQPSGSMLSKTSLTAVFLSAKLDASRLQSLIQSMKQVASELTIVLTDSSFPRDTIDLSKEKLFLVQTDIGSEGLDLKGAIIKALALSPDSERFIVFSRLNARVPSESDILKLASRNVDFLSPSKLNCTLMSRKYAMHIAKTGEVPSIKNATLNGFSAPMALAQMFLSPDLAIRQYSQLVKFALVGASGVVVNLVLLAILNVSVGAVLANAIGVEVSIFNNFIWNDTFTFKKQVSNRSTNTGNSARGRALRFIKYNLVSIGSFSVNTIVFYFAHSVGIWYIWCSLLAIASAFVINYFGSSRWAWGKPKNWVNS